MLTNLIISVGVYAADVWPPTGAIPTPQHHLISLGERGREVKDISEIYTTRHIRKIVRKNFVIIMYGKGQKGFKKIVFSIPRQIKWAVPTDL